ncbi:tyrosine-type recombinase/integrase [Rhizobium beringeri]
MPPANALRRWTYHCLFGLIAVAGLRHSEALSLLRADVDLDQGVLTIRETKFGKSRLVPLHATTIAVLSGYAARRDAHLGTPRSPYFFVAEQGGEIAASIRASRVLATIPANRITTGGESRWPTDS